MLVRVRARLDAGLDDLGAVDPQVHPGGAHLPRVDAQRRRAAALLEALGDLELGRGVEPHEPGADGQAVREVAAQFAIRAASGLSTSSLVVTSPCEALLSR